MGHRKRWGRGYEPFSKKTTNTLVECIKLLDVNLGRGFSQPDPPTPSLGYSDTLLDCGILSVLLDLSKEWKEELASLNKVLLCFFHVSKLRMLGPLAATSGQLG